MDVAAHAGRQTNLVAVSAFTEGNFRERVRNILSGRKYSFIATFVAVVLVISAGIVLLSGAQAGNDDFSAQPGINEIQDENEVSTVTILVEKFGRKLQTVSLLAPEDIVRESIQQNYGDYVSPTLLAEWQENVQNAPGRLVSSPWPDHIDIMDIQKLSGPGYAVVGRIIEITSVEAVNGGVAAQRSIALVVEKVENRWQITALTLGDYENPNSEENENNQSCSINYTSTQYGFNFSLPKSWQGYSIISENWEGFTPGGSAEVETGPLLSIRHPQWTAQEPRQDIPIMIFTLDQWNKMQLGEFHIGAAPIGPKELGRNSSYVFALPARYNFAFPQGYEEVEQILDSDAFYP